MLCTRALISLFCIPCDKAFQFIQNFFILWPWPLCLIYFLMTVTVAIAFERFDICHKYSMLQDFSLVPNCFSLWYSPWCLTYFLRTERQVLQVSTGISCNKTLTPVPPGILYAINVVMHCPVSSNWAWI
jgi:hypothetical protein